MYRVLACLVLVVSFVGCEDVPDRQCPDGRCPIRDCEGGQCPAPQPVTWAEVPGEIRQANYAGGSCAWASMETLFRYHGRDDLADKWRKAYWGGAYTRDVVAACEADDLTYAYTDRGDAAFLDWCSQTRRVAMIHWQGGSHAINFLGYRNGKALLIDNNATQRTIEMDRQRFLAEWRAANGGVALAIADPPPPREPWL